MCNSVILVEIIVVTDEFAIGAQISAMQDELFSPLQSLDFRPSVLALLPLHDIVGLVADHHILIFQRQSDGVGVDREHPVAVTDIEHGRFVHFTFADHNGTPNGNGIKGESPMMCKPGAKSDLHDLCRGTIAIPCRCGTLILDI